jgi:citrate synthase
MAIGRQSIEELLKYMNPKWKTSITKVEPNRIITRGYPQQDLIGNLSFPEMVYLLMQGTKPSENESKMLEAVLVSFCDHGTTPPSTQVARLMASTGSPLNTCVSGGLMSFGKHHAGALEQSMKLLQETVENGVEKDDGAGEAVTGAIESRKDIKINAYELVEEFLENNKKIPGFGHRYHDEDPRAPRLLELAKEYGVYGVHTQLAIAVQDILFEMKNIRMNIDGANAGILSDMGFNWHVGTGLFMIGRLPALISHVNEEQNQESPFRKFIEADEICYDGVEERNP